MEGFPGLAQKYFSKFRKAFKVRVLNIFSHNSFDNIRKVVLALDFGFLVVASELVVIVYGCFDPLVIQI